MKAEDKFGPVDLANVEPDKINLKCEQCQKRDEIIKVQDELVEWLNQECPAVVPPLEPYNNYDLTHTFCDSLRMRLDKIEQLKSEISNENRKSS